MKRNLIVLLLLVSFVASIPVVGAPLRTLTGSDGEYRATSTNPLPISTAGTALSRQTLLLTTDSSGAASGSFSPFTGKLRRFEFRQTDLANGVISIANAAGEEIYRIDNNGQGSLVDVIAVNPSGVTDLVRIEKSITTNGSGVNTGEAFPYQFSGWVKSVRFEIGTMDSGVDPVVNVPNQSYLSLFDIDDVTGDYPLFNTGSSIRGSDGAFGSFVADHGTGPFYNALPYFSCAQGGNAKTGKAVLFYQPLCPFSQTVFYNDTLTITVSGGGNTKSGTFHLYYEPM